MVRRAMTGIAAVILICGIFFSKTLGIHGLGQSLSILVSSIILLFVLNAVVRDSLHTAELEALDVLRVLQNSGGWMPIASILDAVEVRRYQRAVAAKRERRPLASCKSAYFMDVFKVAQAMGQFSAQGRIESYLPTLGTSDKLWRATFRGTTLAD